MSDAAPTRATHAEAVTTSALGAMTLAVVLWASNVLFVRRAGDLLLFTTWRMLLAIPVLAATAGVLRARPTGPPRVMAEPLRLEVRLGLVGIGALFGVSALVNFSAINETTIVNVGVIHALQPAVVALLAGRLLGEVADWRLVTMIGVAIAGASLVAAASTGEGTWSLHGDLLAVLGLGLNSIWFLAGRWVRTRTHLDATTYMSVVFTAGAATLVVMALVAGRSLAVDHSTLVLAALTAVFGTIAHILVAWAHRFLPVALSSLFVLSQPALIAVLAWVAFDEALSPLHVLGGAIVLGSLVRIVMSTDPEPPLAAAGSLPDVLDDEESRNG
ncbi:MAG: DMT family transporter [Microthrixaceae bacterium]